MRGRTITLIISAVVILADPSAGVIPLPDPSVFYPLIPDFLRLKPARPRPARPHPPHPQPQEGHPQPSYQPPAPSEPPTYHKPAPAPPSYHPPVPAPAPPSYNPPAPAPHPAPAPPSYQPPAPVPHPAPAPAPPSYDPPAPAPPSYHPPAPAPQYPSHPTPYHEEPAYPDKPPKYTYKYDVSNHYSGPNFGVSETRDGYKTEGSYTVDLPDGRKKTVTYVDNGHGLMADVMVKGDIKNAPSYHPAPPEPMYS